jgi:hypothetical protein
MVTPIKKFTIYGERSSGTNFLEKSMLLNFNLEFTKDFGHKHFFCFDDCCKKQSDDTLFIGIIRNPVYWLNSFIQKPYHLPNHNKNPKNFLFNEFYSVCDEKPLSTMKKTYDINKKDLNYITGKKYKNIFELRKNKNNYLMNIIPKKVKNYILINYEDLLYNYANILEIIKKKFMLPKKHDKYIRSAGYKQSTTVKYNGEKNIIFPPSLLEHIWSNLDVSQENKLGYFKGNNNKFFKERHKNIVS